MTTPRESRVREQPAESSSREVGSTERWIERGGATVCQRRLGGSRQERAPRRARARKKEENNIEAAAAWGAWRSGRRAVLTFSLASVISRHIFHTLDPAVLRVRRKGRLESVLRSCLVAATGGGLVVHIVRLLNAGPRSSSVVESLLVVQTPVFPSSRAAPSLPREAF